MFKYICFLLFVTFLTQGLGSQSKKLKFINQISDVKNFKKFIKTHTNVLVIFSQTDKDFKDKNLLDDVGKEMKGVASIVHFDCSLDKKACKKLKVFPSPVLLKHYKNGDTHKDYDRPLTLKSLIKFLKDPTGEIPWEEDPSASSVLHIEKINDLKKLIQKEKKPILIMFYAPWCGFCKRLKPEYSAAAKQLSSQAVLAGMDVDGSEMTPVREEYEIKGFPTIIYFKDGAQQFLYGGENNKEGIISWMKNPHPPKEPEPEVEWSKVESDVVHLTDSSFHEILNQSECALVMFYAPWCGHCKKMKPEYEEAASIIKKEKKDCILGALDASKYNSFTTQYSITGFPTLKYFVKGKELFSVNERTKEKIVKFMKNPEAPPPPPPEDQSWEDIESHVIHLGSDDFKSFIKKKKHSLVIFYAPWCGHCKSTKPEFIEAANHFKEDPKKIFVAVDCTKHNKLCSEFGIQGFPTILYFLYGKDERKYPGGRKSKDFINFMEDPFSKSTPTNPPLVHWDDLEGHEVITILKSEQFDWFIQSHPVVMVAFYASACTHCQSMRKDYIEAAKALKQKVAMAAVDAIAETDLRNKFFLTGLPTIKVFKNGKQLMDYDGVRTKAQFISFFDNLPAEVKPLESFPSSFIEHVTSMETLDLKLSQISTNVFFFFDSSTNRCLSSRPYFWESAEKLHNVANFYIVNCVKNQDICKKQNVKEVPEIQVSKGDEVSKMFENEIINTQNIVKFVNDALKSVKVEL